MPVQARPAADSGASHHPAAPLYADELIWGSCGRPGTCYWDPWVRGPYNRSLIGNTVQHAVESVLSLLAMASAMIGSYFGLQLAAQLTIGGSHNDHLMV